MDLKWNDDVEKIVDKASQRIYLLMQMASNASMSLQ
jgi:hypothetical protein